MPATTRAPDPADYHLTSRRQRFEALYTAHSSTVLAYALRRVEVAADAADVIAETFVVAWRRIDDVPAGDEARLWLYGVARRVLANHHRGDRRRDALAARLRDHLATQARTGRPGDDPQAELIRAALRRLDPADREVIELTSWEGLTPAEAAAVLAVPPSTLRSRLQRARGRLRAELETLGWTAPHPHDDQEES
ncbi:RNA polymerase sigma factor [Jiangella alba]|uniref:RNA polymerase, sigma subunit, ECF family n=1 Tax=Jiangella alba TaxID=561176 RepID=A0A1H5MAU5_9ACTN|nr:RNA polymerase sigma factor [Jiangella alba]SEE86619.1 RNA polymerase, sigma subunit, ECF family [Jiangella alba]